MKDLDEKQKRWLDEVKKISKYILQIKQNPTPKNFTPTYVIKELL